MNKTRPDHGIGKPSSIEPRAGSIHICTYRTHTHPTYIGAAQHGRLGSGGGAHERGQGERGNSGDLHPARSVGSDGLEDACAWWIVIVGRESEVSTHPGRRRFGRLGLRGAPVGLGCPARAWTWRLGLLLGTGYECKGKLLDQLIDLGCGWILFRNRPPTAARAWTQSID